MMLSLHVCLILHQRSVFHCCGETAVRRCGGRFSLGGLEDVGAGWIVEHSAAFVVFMGILLHQFAPLLLELPHVAT